MLVGAAVLMLAFNAFAAGQAASGTVRVIARDNAGKPIPNAKVELKLNDKVVSTAQTDPNGQANLSNLAPGIYDVTVSKESFEPLTQNLSVTGNGQVELDFELPPTASVNEQVTVQGGPGQGNPIDQGASPPTTLAPAQLQALPSKPATVSDALPLVPGVVRSPQGGLEISGSDEAHSALIVNSVDVTDPATGQFGVTVPVVSVQTLSVYQTPYSAEFGRFTAGVVAVETKPGTNKWHFELNDPLPDFRIFSGHLVGIRDAVPRVDVSGPLIHDKLFISEGIEYQIVKTPVKALAFPDNESKTQGVNSFTQFDYHISPDNTLTVTFHAVPWRASFVNLSFFMPQAVSPDSSAGDYTGTVIDNLILGTSLLQSTVSVKSFSGDVWGQGDADMMLTPNGDLGNYFSQQHRRAHRAEWLETYSLAPIQRAGQHNLKFGWILTGTANRGQFLADPVDIENDEGLLLRRISFVGGNPFDRHDTEAEGFGQDHWQITQNFAIDLGLRLDYQAITQTLRIAPRGGIAWTPFGSKAKTVVRGGYGIFYDHVPLGVYSFPSYPEQLVTNFGPDGQIIGVPRLFQNITESEAATFPFIRSSDQIGDFAPYSSNWSLEVDQPISKFLQVRTSYLQSNSSGLVLISPEVVDKSAALVEGGGGKARYRQFEITGKVTLSKDRDLYFSYVRSRSQGDLNAFENYLGNYPFPLVRPDEFSNLPGDLPNRFLVWGVIHLPWKMRIAPIIEYRNGFPYSIVNVEQNYVGTANTARFPNFYSADARISKDIKLNDKYGLRFSVNGFNLTDHFNPSAVYANTGSPLFGVFFGQYLRKFTADFDV
ncbi:MAG TPA: TonB-dependent receptor, partial [Blastocatellia bacterium]